MKEQPESLIEAGRELDALIAEKVMEWKRYPIPFNREQTALLPNYAATALLRLGDDLNRVVPPYSTDIAAAWQVVQKIRETWLSFELRWQTPGRYSGPGVVDGFSAYFSSDTEPFFAFAIADTAPLAISTAALKALHA